MLTRGFTDDNLFNSSFDSQLPEPHIVALLHKALLYLVPYLQMSPELILEKFHRLLHSSNFDIKYLNQPSPVQSSLLSASVLGQQAGQGLQSVDHHFHFHGLCFLFRYCLIHCRPSSLHFISLSMTLLTPTGALYTIVHNFNNNWI